MMDLHQIVQEMLEIGLQTVAKNPHATKEVGTTNIKGDKTIGMDVLVEKALIAYIKEKNIPANIFSEEAGDIKFHNQPKYYIAFDPLDGSTNYQIGKNIYPYGLLIVVYKGINPKLSDVVASGAIEYSRNLSWTYVDEKTYDQAGNPVVLKLDWEISRKTPIFLDLYYKEGYELYRPIAEQLFIRNIGSTIGNLSYVLSNIAAGLGGVCMRPEEIGAIYSLVRGAGGVTLDHTGKDLGEQLFSGNKTYQIIAGSKNIVNYAIKMLQNN